MASIFICWTVLQNVLRKVAVLPGRKPGRSRTCLYQRGMLPKREILEIDSFSKTRVLCFALPQQFLEKILSHITIHDQQLSVIQKIDDSQLYPPEIIQAT
jgi:hypothetical protein